MELKIIEQDFSKTDIEIAGEAIALKFMDGFKNPIEAAVQLQATIKSMEFAYNKMKDEVLEEIEKYGKSTEHRGVKIEISNSGRYDYSNCGDPIYIELLQEKEDLDVRLKKREKFLQNCLIGEIITNPNTGETVEVYPPIKPITTSPKLTFPK